MLQCRHRDSEAERHSWHRYPRRHRERAPERLWDDESGEQREEGEDEVGLIDLLLTVLIPRPLLHRLEKG